MAVGTKTMSKRSGGATWSGVGADAGILLAVSAVLVLIAARLYPRMVT